MDLNILKESIDSWLLSYFKSKEGYNRKIYEAMDYSLTIGGKRIRPMLLILSYSLFKEDFTKVLPISGAVEMIHTYSLIHDDLPCMDDDDLRRGKPTSHKVFGEAVAVLAGDGLLNEAMNILFEQSMKLGSSALKASRLIASAAGADGMIGGQLVDILSENKGSSMNEEELKYMHSKKTGELIKAPILAGAVLGGACEEELAILGSYGEKLGLAFQIKDDILDVVGDTALLGKKVNSDAANHKTTFITLYGLENCIKMCCDLSKECIDLLNSLKRPTEDLKQLTNFLLEREF